jgi:hypothetical protein
MNRELEEQKIRQWFREARHGDESRAPSFVETLAAAQSKTRRGGWRLNVWRIAFVTVALIAISVTTVVFFKQSVTQPFNKAAAGSNVERLPGDRHPHVAVAPPSPRFVRARPINGSLANFRRSPRRPRVAQPQGDFGQALLSLKWQSPTDFLLRTPGADLLKTVPRLGDSLIRFDVIHSDEKN